MSSPKQFYRSFEDRYRGSRELVKSRLNVYRDFLSPLVPFFEKANAVDLGCGRGEFLEVLLSCGFFARGVDLDEGMLEACSEMGLPAQKADLLPFVKGLPDQSQVVVSAFHVVEHMEFSELMALVTEALRVLAPGGVLILETPNPENLTVSGTTFYLDPTHNKPLAPQLLDFIAEYAGFARVKTVRLQEVRYHGDTLTLASIFSGVSPDYSVVAQKSGPEAVMGCLDPCFQRDYGRNLQDAIKDYDEVLSNRVHSLERQIEILQKTSLSWRSRTIAASIKRFTVCCIRALKPVALLLMRPVVNLVRRSPRLEAHIKRVLIRFPHFRRLLMTAVLSESFTMKGSAQSLPDSVQQLSALGRRLYINFRLAGSKSA